MATFNKDEMHAPSWMDNAFFEKVLKHSENDTGLTVTGSKIVPGTKPGDHFASIIFRAAVSYNSREKDSETSLIIKTVPELEGLKKDLLKDGSIFETETIMYSTVVPEMHRLLRSVGDDTELGPSLLYSSKDPQWVMVFEDIGKRGYSMKSSQLDLHDAKLVYAKLARWHAASVYLAETVPVIRTLTKGIGNMGNQEFTDIWRSYIAQLAKVCLEWPGYEMFFEKLNAIKGPIFDKLAEIYNFSESTLYNVLNHGDFHYKNMMYNVVEGETKDILLLDFQLSLWGTPAIDIIYSLYSTCSTETRDNHRDELIKFYHDEFVAALNKFGYLKKIPTLIDLQVEVLKCGQMETFLATTFMAFMILPFEEMMAQGPKSEDEGFELDFADTDKMLTMITACFRHPTYAATIKRYLPMYLHKGFHDI